MKLFLTWLIIFYFRFVNKFNLYKNNHSSNKIDLDISILLNYSLKFNLKYLFNYILKKTFLI